MVPSHLSPRSFADVITVGPRQRDIWIFYRRFQGLLTTTLATCQKNIAGP